MHFQSKLNLQSRHHMNVKKLLQDLPLTVSSHSPLTKLASEKHLGKFDLFWTPMFIFSGAWRCSQRNLGSGRRHLSDFTTWLLSCTHKHETWAFVWVQHGGLEVLSTGLQTARHSAWCMAPGGLLSVFYRTTEEVIPAAGTLEWGHSELAPTTSSAKSRDMLPNLIEFCLPNSGRVKE